MAGGRGGGGGRTSMRVIARIPRLDAAGPDGTPCGVVDRGVVSVPAGPSSHAGPSPAAVCRGEADLHAGPSPDPCAEAGDRTNPVAAAPPDDRGRRRSGSRFPIVSTLVLAAFAGASWAAVWWQERARESVTMSEGDGPVGRTADAGALHPDDGSLTR